MEAELKVATALTAFALASGCATGDDGGSPPPPPAEYTVSTDRCGYYAIFDVYGACGGSHEERLKEQLGFPTSTPPFQSWSQLPAFEGSSFGSVQYQYDIIGADVPYAQTGYWSLTSTVSAVGFGYRGSGPLYDGGRTLHSTYAFTRWGASFANLASIGQPGFDVAYDHPNGGPYPTSPFLGLSAGEMELVANPYSLGWNYQSFGVWDDHNGGVSSQILAKSYGAATPASAVPTTGSALFKGKLGGLYVDATGAGSIAIADLSVGADFSARSLTFASSGTIATRTLQSASAAPGLDLGGTLTYSPGSGAFSGTLVNAGGTMTGSSVGRFYGPAANELGGVFAVKSATTPEAFSGAYGAKR